MNFDPTADDHHAQAVLLAVDPRLDAAKVLWTFDCALELAHELTYWVQMVVLHC